MNTLKIKFDNQSTGEVILNGHNIANVSSRVTIDSKAGDPPKVIIEMYPDEIELEINTEAILKMIKNAT